MAKDRSEGVAAGIPEGRVTYAAFDWVLTPGFDWEAVGSGETMPRPEILESAFPAFTGHTSKGRPWKPFTAPQVSPVTVEFSELREEIRTLTTAVRALEETIAGRNASEARDVSDEEAKSEVSALLMAREELYPSDIASELELPYDQVSRILDQLEADGAVAPERLQS